MSQRQPNNRSSPKNPVGRFMVASGGVIELNDSRKILIIQRSPDLDWHPNVWEIMYGRIDQFEDPQQGLIREIGEEVGLTDIKIVDILDAWHIYRGTEKTVQNDLIGITFWCRTKNPKVKLSSEHQAYKWVKPEKALAISDLAGVKRDISAFIKRRNKCFHG